MKELVLIAITFFLFLLVACNNSKTENDYMETSEFISENVTIGVVSQLIDSLGEEHRFRIERGVKQVAGLWRESDGSHEDFSQFCKESFIANDEQIESLYGTLERNFEVINGYFHKMNVELKMPLQLVGPDITPVDMMFGSYSASSHLSEDFYSNKIAFITALNFPFYSLEEKTELGANWSRREWAYARMGDMFISRVPSNIQQHISKTLTEADTYISDYNIYMGNLRNDEGVQLFPDNMKLISHWGLRDELKSNYADNENGLEKQRIIYRVMQRIIDQSIPTQIINKGEFNWNPYSNEIFKDGESVIITPEETGRYEVLLNNFKAVRQSDTYSPHYPTQIDRAFAGRMEILKEDVEELFVELVSSPQVKKVAKLIELRLGRELEPFDIWYNGFSSGKGIGEEELNKITSRRYSNPADLEADIPNILVKLGWKSEKANEIGSLIKVEASRGAGHAWGSAMRNDVARLRTRIGDDGMDYKGYNIAIHELGHNVEQIITMNDVDFYTLNGVPNTAFTEAVAFLFQKRDLELLNLQNPNTEDVYYETLSTFWNTFEIMGVSLVDIKVWEWLYANPNTTASELKEIVISISKDVWNKYYAEVLGGEDETLLAVYSHMIDNPLYLPNYPIGHLINFQIEQHVRGKNLAEEMDRMYTQGSIVPQVWMNSAVGSPISIEPLLAAADEALEALR